MDTLLERIMKCRETVYSKNKETGASEYQIVPHFKETSFESLGEGIESPIFRSFVPIKPSSGRAMRGNKFDIYKDSLFDYPNIIAKEMNKRWEEYNYLVSVHVGCCPLNCWYCYVDECLRIECEDCYFEGQGQCKNQRKRFNDRKYSSDEIFKEFHYEYRRNNKKKVLRITGGEPFLVPEMILELLTHIKKLELDNELFVWVETNLTPFLIDKKSGKRAYELYSDIEIGELEKFSNWALHPCLHGSSKDNFKSQTGFNIDFKALLEALYYLCDSSIEIYPSIASNLCPTNELESLFDELNGRFINLPLRFALIENDLNYPPIKDRLSSGLVDEGELFNKWQNIYVWDKKCTSECGHGYATIPREGAIPGSKLLVEQLSKPDLPQERSSSRDNVRQGDAIYIFKSCYRDLYKKELLSIISLPNETIFKLEYREDLLHSSFIDWLNGSEKKKRPEGLLVYMDRDETELGRFIPLRRIKIEDIEVGETAAIWIRLGEIVFPGGSFYKDILTIIGERWPGFVGQLFVNLKWSTARSYAAVASLGSVSQ